GLGVEHADLVGGELREGEAAIFSHVAAPRPGGGGWYRIDQCGTGLVGPADVPIGKIHEPEIVLRIAGDSIRAMRRPPRDRLERLDVFEFAGRRIKPVEGARTTLAEPDLPVDMRIARVDHPDLHAG